MTELPIDENTPRILIVEDEPKLGQLLIDYLRAASYAPTLISHGDQVLPYIRQTPPDLILLDLMLPGTDGLTLCREIRRFSDVPIIMVTAKIEEIDRLLLYFRLLLTSIIFISTISFSLLSYLLNGMNACTPMLSLYF